MRVATTPPSLGRLSSLTTNRYDNLKLLVHCHLVEVYVEDGALCGFVLDLTDDDGLSSITYVEIDQAAAGATLSQVHAVLPRWAQRAGEP